MPSEDPIIVVPADTAWPEEFRRIAAPIRTALGDVALRIDHVGSTSVPGLDAKPILDLQVSVERLEPMERYRPALEKLGYRWQDDNPDVSKRFFRQRVDGRGVHIHVREAGTFDEQLNLLFRDYLRTHAEDARTYARNKWGLAEKFRNDRTGYVAAKDPTVWEILRSAHDWAQQSGWRPGPSDA